MPDTDPRKQLIAQRVLRTDHIEDETDLWRRAVPIVIHGDGVPVGKMSLDALSWSGFLQKGSSTTACKLLVSGLMSRNKSPDTAPVYWGVVAWAFMVLLSGIFPARDWDGNPYVEGPNFNRVGTWLAGGLFAVVWVVKGDMDWVANTLGLEGSSSVCICPWCKANTIEDDTDQWAVEFNVPCAPWNDLGAEAVWRSTLWTSIPAWLQEHGGRHRVHPLFLLPGVSIFSLMADVLHVFDLGVTHHVLGSVLWTLCFVSKYIPTAATPAGRLAYLWGRIIQHYRGAGTANQLGNLTLAMFCDPGAPYAHIPVLANRVKAAESRHLVPVLSSIFATLAEPGDPTDEAIVAVLEALSLFYATIECEGYRLSPQALGQVQFQMDRLLNNYRVLSVGAREVGRLLWHETPKFHYAQHVSLQSALGNPRYHWTYMEEDFMGHLKTICERCTEGTPAHGVVYKLLEKWGFGVALKLKRD